MVLISASMITNVVLADLLPLTRGRHFLIDIGSALDVLVDEPSLDEPGVRRLPFGDPERWRPCFNGSRPLCGEAGVGGIHPITVPGLPFTTHFGAF